MFSDSLRLFLPIRAILFYSNFVFLVIRIKYYTNTKMTDIHLLHENAALFWQNIYERRAFP